MPLDFPTAVWCLAIPMLLAVVGSIASWMHCRRTINRSRSTVAPLPADQPGLGAPASPPLLDPALGWTAGLIQVMLGLCLSVAAIGSLQPKLGITSLLQFQDQAWCQLVWGMLVASLLAFTRRADQPRFSSYWVASSLVAIATAFAIMPSGESWSDTAPLHRYWLPLVAISAIANHWALRQLIVRGAERWVLCVALASLAGPLILCAASYSALLNLCLAVSSALTCFAVLTAVGIVKDAQGVLLPTTLCAGAMTASARFYSYDEPSPVVYGLAMFLPVLIDAIDRPLRRQATWRRALVAAMICTAIILFLGYQVLSPTKEEW